MRHAVRLYHGKRSGPAWKIDWLELSASSGGGSYSLYFCLGLITLLAQGRTHLSSAEDTRLLTTSLSAGSSKLPSEELPNEPGDSEAVPATPPLSTKANMVAHEVRVMVIGAHLSKVSADRELFTEETNSVLVHENGGVIQLSAAVTPGQLLFLSNVESKQEVVAQVKRKRVYRPTSCYIELEFAEPAPRFWGMEFSAASSLLPKDAKDREAAALVISAEASSDEPIEQLAAPAGEEVQALKQQVRAKRGQAANANAVVESGSVDDHRVPMQLKPVEETQLPKPSLDFTMPKARKFFGARGNFTPGFRGGVLRLALLTAALLITATGAAWYKNWFPWSAGAKRPAVNGPTTSTNTTSLAPRTRETATEHPEFNNTKVAGDAPVTLQMAESAARRVASGSLLAQPALHGGSSSTPPEKRAVVRPTAKVLSDMAPSGSESLVPPKLIKSVRALASLDALRDFETGNVIIDAVVGTEGEVHFLSVLSGPPSLRAPAVEAVKQYRYEPATRNGQPVPARVKIEIRFRFES
jgi:TonB family protein